MAMQDKGGMAGYSSAVSKKKKNKKVATSKADYRPGGMYGTGRAIPPSPGTKKNSRVTTPKPSKSAGVNRNTKVTSATPSKSASTRRKAMRGADAYGNPANRNTNKKYK